MDLSFRCKTVQVTPENSKLMTVEIFDADEAEIIKQFSVGDILEEIDEEDFLKKIGREKAIEYFDIKEAENE